MMVRLLPVHLLTREMSNVEKLERKIQRNTKRKRRV